MAQVLPRCAASMAGVVGVAPLRSARTAAASCAGKRRHLHASRRPHGAALPTTTLVGTADTPDFAITYSHGDRQVSPWHDIPLASAEGNGLFNFIVEIPKFTTAKMEIDTKLPHNPIVQDTKNGKLRDYHGKIFWNYGCIPQTWEDPNVALPEVGGLFGDNDPLDVVEIGSACLPMGSIAAIKPLGALCMIDDGEVDWKIIAINAADPLAHELNNTEDLERVLPHTIAGIREWFRWYKTPDGKPLNGFGFDEALIPADHVMEVIDETHHHWKNLRSGQTPADGLWVA